MRALPWIIAGAVGVAGVIGYFAFVRKPSGRRYGGGAALDPSRPAYGYGQQADNTPQYISAISGGISSLANTGLNYYKEFSKDSGGVDESGSYDASSASIGPEYGAGSLGTDGGVGDLAGEGGWDEYDT